MKANPIILEKGWILKNKIGNIYTEHKTREEARGVRREYNHYSLGGDVLLLYKFFKIVDIETGNITLLMTRSS